MGRRRKAWLWSQNGRRLVAGKRLPGYYVRYYEYRHDGSRVNRSKCFSTIRLARQFVRQFNARLELGLLGQVVPIGLNEANRQFLLGCAGLAPGTQIHYASAVRMLLEHVGDIEVSAVSPDQIESFIRWRMGQAGEATAAKHIRSLRRFFNWAISRGYAADSPISLVSVLPSDTIVRVRPPVSDADIARIMAELETEDQRLAAWLAMTTGLDREVVTGLVPGHIDRDACCIRIQRPKTRRRKARLIIAPIHAALTPSLFARLDHTQPNQPLLQGVARQTRAKDWWRRAAEAAGLPGVLFRDLRAVATSRPQSLAGATLPQVQRLLGHSSIDTTARHYTLPDPDLVTRLDALPLPGFPHTPGATKP